MLIFLSAGQTVGAQQQTQKAIDYDWIVTGPPGNICFNEYVNYTVRVVRKIRLVEGAEPDTAYISSVTVGAKIADENIISSGNARLLRVDLSDPDKLEVFSLYFPMTARNKVGSTTITFAAEISSFPVTHIYKVMQVNVESCIVIVSWANNWGPLTAGTGGSVGVAAHFDNATLTADDKGHYTGKSKVKWSPSVSLPADCAPLDIIGSADADIQGDIDKNGLLNLTLTFQATSLEEEHACGKIHHTSSVLAAQILKVPPLNFERLSISVPQNLKVKNSISIPGSAQVTISIDKGD